MIRCGSVSQSSSLASQRGSILITSLVILMILMTIFLSVATYSLTRHGFHVKAANRLTASHLAESGIQRALADITADNLFPENPGIKTPNGGSISYSTTVWGPYLLVFSKGTKANQTVVTTALIGSRPHEFFDAAVTVADENYPFAVAGNSRIYGDVNTGPLGMEAGRIRGEGVATPEFHVGRACEHQSLSVPALDSVVLSHYYDSMAARRSSVDHTDHGSLIVRQGSEDPFENGPTLYVENNLVIDGANLSSYGEIKSIFVGGSVEIRGASHLSGLIEIVADGHVLLTDSACLDEVILRAEDSIVFRGACQFSGQAICSREISVRDSSRLVYPSLLLLDSSEEIAADRSMIHLASRVTMESMCFIAPSDASSSGARLLHLDTATTFTGYLVSHDKTQLQGSLRGSVVTEQFYLHLPPTTYVNWVKDCLIYREGLDYAPALPILQEDSESYSILRLDGDRP